MVLPPESPSAPVVAPLSKVGSDTAPIPAPGKNIFKPDNPPVPIFSSGLPGNQSTFENESDVLEILRSMENNAERPGALGELTKDQLTNITFSMMGTVEETCEKIATRSNLATLS